MYGSEVLFIGKEISDFEMVHLSFLKNMLGVKQQTTSVRPTIYMEIQEGILSFYNNKF